MQSTKEAAQPYLDSAAEQAGEMRLAFELVHNIGQYCKAKIDSMWDYAAGQVKKTTQDTTSSYVDAAADNAGAYTLLLSDSQQCCMGSIVQPPACFALNWN